MCIVLLVLGCNVPLSPTRQPQELPGTQQDDADSDCVTQPAWADDDGDGWGGRHLGDFCTPPAGSAANADDCDDTDPAVHPDTVWYADVDGDGYGAEEALAVQCEQPSGSSYTSGDCDDTDADVFPGQVESCDGFDEDCDGLVDDDALDANTFYVDDDGDGYGDASTEVVSCWLEDGVADNGLDCDDTEAEIHPLATEICDDIDWDCSGRPDNGCDVRQATDGTVVGSTGYQALFGSSFVIADFDSDGVDELAIGAPGEAGTHYRNGAVFLTSGLADGTIQSQADAVVNGALQYGSLGRAVAAGDLDDDGYTDLFASAAGDGDCTTCGEARLIRGPIEGTVDAHDARLFHTRSGAMIGGQLAVADIDGDGIDDALIGSENASPEGSLTWSGAVFAVLGPISGERNAFEDADGEFWGDSFDYAAKSFSAGDADGDGVSDVLVGAEYHTAAQGGAVFLLGGPTLAGHVLTTKDAWAVIDNDTGEDDAFGRSVQLTADIDGAGLSDVLVGAPRQTRDDGEGAAYLFVGPISGVATSWDHHAAFVGGEGAQAFGSVVDGRSDLDGDGQADIVITDPEWGDGLGAAYVFYGPFTGTRMAAAADVVIEGTEATGRLGTALLTGDSDGNGDDEVILGAPMTEATTGLVVGFEL